MDIVKKHSLGAAAAGVGSGGIPGAGGAALALVAEGFVWTMYGKINSKIGLPMSENIVRSLATGVATNLATYALGAVVLSTVFSLVPGLGSITASVVAGATTYALTVAGGLVYFKLLTSLFLSGKDPIALDADALKQAARDVAEREDIGTFMRKARDAYKEQAD